MSILIDDLLNQNCKSEVEINGRYYVAKPAPFCGRTEVEQRIKDAIKVLTGEVLAVHYKEDEEVLS
jgi:hypothetical protein